MAKSATSRALALCLATIIASPVLAQGGPGMMGRDGDNSGKGSGWGADRGMGWGMGWHMWGGQDGGGGWGGHRWGRGPQGMLDRIDGRLAFLKTELKITEAQQPQWSRFADVVKTTAQRMNEHMRSIWAGDEKATTLLQRLELQEQAMSTRLEEIKQMRAAFKDLYAVLDEAQKKEADTLALPMMGMGGMMGGGMMGQGGGPGMGPGMMGR